MGNNQNIPTNWPSNVNYTTRNIYSKSIPSDILQNLTGKSTVSQANSTSAFPPQTAKHVANVGGVKIRLITNKSHPACGQYGLFAARKLKPKAHVLDYMGVVHTDQEADPDSDYDITLDGGAITMVKNLETGEEKEERMPISIDAWKWGNEGRMVNDYRGIGDKPNVQFDEHIVQGEQRIGIFVMDKEIQKGEELLVSYGKGMFNKKKN